MKKKDFAEHNTSKPDENSTTADILVDRLISWNVEVIFGLIGDGINPLVEALRKRKDEIKFITVRHEEAAAFMACAYAKFSGKLGACIATTGPGSIHLMNGIYDAAMEDVPVIAITGSVFHDVSGTQYTQEVDMISLMKDATVYNKRIEGPRNAITVVDLACRAALTTPGVAHLSIATDLQQRPLSDDEPSQKLSTLHGSSTSAPTAATPSEEELETAAKILNEGSRIMILAGRGALHATEELEQLAEKVGAPVAKALLGKALMADDSPYTTGGIGVLGTLPSKQMMEDCDTLLILGSNMPYIDYYPKPGQSKGIQVDRDPKKIGLRYPVNAAVVGDVKATLKALLPKLERRNDRSFLELAQQRMKEWRTTLAEQENDTSFPIKPQYLVSRVNKMLEEDAMISIDTGAHTVFSARHLQAKPNQQIAVSGNLATMGPGLPYSIAAQIAFPERQSVALVGDGGFTMLMGEVATAVRYDLPVKVVIFKNNTLSMDEMEQIERGNEPFGHKLQDIDFAKVAEGCGAEGYRCSKSEELEATLAKAFASNRAAVIEVSIDPRELPEAPGKMKD